MGHPAQSGRAAIAADIDRLQEAGRLAEAAELCRTVLGDPGLPNSESAQYWRRLARLSHRLGDRTASIEAYLQVITSDPDDAESFFDLGNMLFSMGKASGAASLLRQASRLAPMNPQVHHNLGHALSTLGKREEAESHLRIALRLAPNDITFLRTLASFLRADGRNGEARDCYRAILAQDPRDSVAHENLAALGSYAPDDPHIAQMEALFAEPGLSATDRVNLGYGLFKAHDRAGQADRAFAALAEANKVQRSILDFDPSIEKRAFARMKEVFTPAFFAGRRDVGYSAIAPIFIVGLPRSGTTLTEQILSAHSEVAAGGESQAMTELVRRNLAAPDGVSGLGLDPERFAPEEAERLGGAYAESMATITGEARRFTDKLPLNFRWVGIIAAILPSAVFVHCRRNPLENCFSVFSNHFVSGGNRYSYDLVELADYYAEYRALMAHWQAVLPGRIHDLRLESLIADQEGETRRLLEFCGLDFEEACLDFQQNRNPVKTLSSEQVRKPLYGGHKDRIRPYEPFLGPLTERLAGYD